MEDSTKHKSDEDIINIKIWAEGNKTGKSKVLVRDFDIDISLDL